MYHPTTRVLGVLELLQAHGRLSGAELAERLEVDRRTLRRYISTLESMGIPIATERGRHGGYALVPGFKLPPLMFTEDEAVALSVGLLAARGLGLAEGSLAAASAQAKLERVIPEALRRRVRAVNETVKLAGARATGQADNGLLVTLSLAAQLGQRVHLRYRDARSGATERDFDPYGLVFLDGRWYASGMCHLRGELRSFRLDRMLSLELGEQRFQRPGDFDALEHLLRSVATLPRAYTIEVILKTDMATARAHLFNAIGVLTEAEGGVLVRNQSDDLDWFARQLARLPFGFKVLRPVELHAAIRECATRLLEQAGEV
ncbi:YafY family transcriptional regulator [Oxalobacteraceae bacterium OM1]|nr:YafY family transcriptional regulator [Oxalobacteraceae bacterium OM1]